MSILGGRKAATEPTPAPAGLSIIAVGLTVRGDLDSNGTVKVEGAVEGHVTTRAQVLVAKGGIVHGDVEAVEAIVGGTVTGAIRASERVEIQNGAVVSGDVTTRRIMVAEGASLNGQVRMGEGAVSERPAINRGEPTRPAASVAATQVPSRPSVPIARVAVPPRQPIP